MIDSPRPRRRERRLVHPFGVRVGGVCLILIWGLLGAGCNNRHKPEDKPLPAPPPPSSAHSVAPGGPQLPKELEAQTPEQDAEPEPDPPLVVGPPQPPAWDGPHLVVTRTSAGVYSEPKFERAKKIGYLRNGAAVAVKKEIVSTDSCKKGWHEIVGGGFICENLGTLDPKDPGLKFVQKQPVLDDILPYTYARNAKNGTPLYKSVPTPEQMYGYEPYLEAAKKWRKKQEEEAAAEAAAARRAEESTEPSDSESGSKPTAKASPSSKPKPHDGDGASEDDSARDTERVSDDGKNKPDRTSGDPDTVAASSDETPAEEPTTPWWQQDGENSKLHEVTLEDLQKEADDVLAMRMMKGFYVAIDKTFRWNDRLWYKTTKELVAPADRFWQVAGSKFHGVALDDGKYALPVGFVYGSRKTATLYELDSDDKLKPAGSVDRFDAVNLTGKERKIAKNDYLETSNGRWIKAYQVRVAKLPEAMKDGIGPRERWLDINVSTQTLVAYVGTKPVYATLVSSGKESKVKEKDHRTPRGEWRIREKHVATTMDGDGSAAGDLPYSIEDVPFVAYFERSYAVHGAFWHQNFGVNMSHGCVNLSPLDAKWVFFFTDPQLPAGWHGVWSTDKNPGSRVVVHE